MNMCRLGCLCLTLVAVGCAQQTVDPNRPKTVPVTGTVTYNGSPVEGATVTFIAKGGGVRGAVAKTDASGKFTMTTFDAGDGAIPGSYAVMISKTIVEGGLSQEEMENWEGEGEPPTGTQVEKLPVMYKDASKSGLTAEIAEGDNNLTFELTDQGAPTGG